MSEQKTILPPSEKQQQILAFGFTDYDALICDGAIRSGKTMFMIIAFIDWAMREYNGQLFGVCGKTVDSAIKNIITPYMGTSYARKRYALRWNKQDKLLTATRGSVTNRFEVFGGKDESSYSLIQGRTFAGALLDEVALMPRSFVEQALARCSVEGAKQWFNCNPENPHHWFREEWIEKAPERNALHLHFLMDDNPSLSERTRERYRRTYTGVFFDRYILGKWVMAEGLIYDMFDESANVYKAAPVGSLYVSQRTIAVDYGTANPTVFLDIYDDGETIRVEREYRWDSRKELRQKTDEEYADDFMDFMGGDWCGVLVDPSAASFIQALRRRGVFVTPANNDVLDGIRRTGNLIARRVIQINERSGGLIGEMGAYSWDETAAMHGVERPVKQFDHGADALRYYCNSLPDWRFEF